MFCHCLSRITIKIISWFGRLIGYLFWHPLWKSFVCSANLNVTATAGKLVHEIWGRMIGSILVQNNFPDGWEELKFCGWGWAIYSWTECVTSHIIENMISFEVQSDVLGFFHCLIGWDNLRLLSTMNVNPSCWATIPNECCTKKSFFFWESICRANTRGALIKSLLSRVCMQLV